MNLFPATFPSTLAVLAMSIVTQLAFGQEPGTAYNPSAGHGVQRGYADINGLKLYYEIHSAGGIPLVLLHGGGSTIETTFGNVLTLLAASRQIIAFEQQGHGRTNDIADRPFTFDQSADDAAELLRRLKIEKADFFGFSNGGSIAIQVAIRHPGLVRKLVVASAMYKRSGLYPEVLKFIERGTPDDMPKEYQEAYRQLSPHPDQLRSFHDKCAKRMLEFKDWPEDDIRSIKVPTLVLIGDADCVRPEHAVEMFRLLPHGQLAILPGGHGAYIGEATAARVDNSRITFGAMKSSPRKANKVPELVVALIEQFLDSAR